MTAIKMDSISILFLFKEQLHAGSSVGILTACQVIPVSKSTVAV